MTCLPALICADGFLHPTAARSSRRTGLQAAKDSVLCHGEILFDCIAHPSAAGQNLQEITEAGTWTPYAGGAPANVACALVKLGVSAAFCGAVGRDADGDALIQVLQENSVDASLVQRVDHMPTRRCM